MARVLVIDDNAAGRLLLKRILERSGHEFVEASNAAEAVNYVSQHTVDLIIADLQMPGANGLQLTRQMRKIPSVANTPILIFTANALPEVEQQVYDAGATGYMIKPALADKLVAKINELLTGDF